MKKYIALLSCLLLAFGCKKNEPKTTFSPEVMSQKVTSIDGQEMTFSDALSFHKGNKTIIDIWASWCPDCIKSLSEIKEFQEKNPEVNFLFTSVDKDATNWRNGVKSQVESKGIKGNHILMSGGWGRGEGSAFTEYIGLDWIPRYMLLDESGNIEVYYVKSLDDTQITEALGK